MARTRDAEALHRRLIVIDGTCPLANRLEYLPRWIDGGTTALAPALDTFHEMPGGRDRLARERPAGVPGVSGRGHLGTADAYPPPPWHYSEGLEMPSGFPRLTEALLAKGYPEPDIEKIMGGNYLRVLRQVCG